MRIRHTGSGTAGGWTIIATVVEHEVPVLIVGGGLAGSSAALFLGWHGVDSLTVERHAGPAVAPRAGHLHLRTMEILRSVGLEEAVRRKGEQQYHPDGGIDNVESLAGKQIADWVPDPSDGVAEFSPTVRLFINQDALEPILAASATGLGARLRYRTECVGFKQDSDGVTAVLADLETGRRSEVRARYLIAADGNRSPIREWLGIKMHGHGLLSNSITIYFRAGAGLGPLLKGRNQGVHHVTNPMLRGFFQLDRTGDAGFLVVNLVGDISRPEIVAAYPAAPWANVASRITERRARELLRAAIGVPHMPVTIEHIATWQAVADVAESFQDGRVFLAGDAAHVVPPNDGYGGNTGVADAHNLAWKLAYVLNGVAGPDLLDSYDAERRPVGELTMEQAYARYVARVAPYLGTDTTQPLVDDLSIQIGYRYDSPAVVMAPDGDRPPHSHPRESRGRPGSRAPHVWLEQHRTRTSTLDLFGRNFVMLAGAQAGAWRAAAFAAARECGIEIEVYQVGSGDVAAAGGADLADVDDSFPGAYGIGADGAVLVRPDGFVGWRSGADIGRPEQVLPRVMNALLCRGGRRGVSRLRSG